MTSLARKRSLLVDSQEATRATKSMRSNEVDDVTTAANGRLPTGNIHPLAGSQVPNGPNLKGMPNISKNVHPGPTAQPGKYYGIFLWNV